MCGEFWEGRPSGTTEWHCNFAENQGRAVAHIHKTMAIAIVYPRVSGICIVAWLGHNAQWRETEWHFHIPCTIFITTMFIFSRSNRTPPATEDEELIPSPSLEQQIASINARIIEAATPLAGPQQNPEAKMNDGSEDDMDAGRWYIPVSKFMVQLQWH